MPFLQRLKSLCRQILSCCDKEYDHSGRVLQIGPPTNFRREEVHIEGLSAEDQALIREKAHLDVSRIFPSAITPYTDSTSNLPMSSITNPPTSSSSSSPPSRMNRLRAHSRKFSGKFCGYQPVEGDAKDDGAREGLMAAAAAAEPESTPELGAIATRHGSRDSTTLGGSGSEEEKEGAEGKKGKGEVV
ncbi:hypothetical protein K402DRAFT_464678 [Aulographum hederae CBS 113979]|uniref:Uncharacterized protein n=1 Tax=Aulographum hederae CBS 113979 TaxID=1176131 RepID=A0A6G1GW84_9PEZI|nr:hypothetical protein K402DRAFT_464678 [Aulographum hederae CBS 113979]